MCMDLKLEMYEMGMPKGCVIVLYLGCGVRVWGFGRCWGSRLRWWCVVCGMWYVFGEKIVVACKSALFNFLDLVWYLFWNSLMVSMHVLVRSWILGKGGNVEGRDFLRNFST